MKPKRAALYARCSTREQSTDPQLDRLCAYAAASGLQVVEEYVDQGQSGRKDRRPALDALLRDARRRRFDAVCAIKLDRLARSTRHLTAMAAELEAVGVDLIVTDQAIDTRSPSGKLLFDVLAAIAEFEAAINGERTAAGMQAAKRRGARMGRPRAQVDRAVLVRGGGARGRQYGRARPAPGDRPIDGPEAAGGGGEKGPRPRGENPSDDAGRRRRVEGGEKGCLYAMRAR